VQSLNEQLSAASDALDSKSSDLITLQRTSADATLKLQREMAEVQAALEDVRAAEESARRRASAAEERLAASQVRQAEVETNAAEQERSLGDQLRNALVQAERYQALAANEQKKREEATRVMAEMREQMTAASRAHQEALEAAEAQAADARQLADLYQQQVADFKAQLSAVQQAGGIVPPPPVPGTPPARVPVPVDPHAIATAADLLAPTVVQGLQQQGKSHADVVALYTDMVSESAEGAGGGGGWCSSCS